MRGRFHENSIHGHRHGINRRLLLGALRGHGADESETGAPTTLADAGVAAPNFVGIKTWLNSAPLSIAELRGNVVLVGFLDVWLLQLCQHAAPRHSALRHLQGQGPHRRWYPHA